MRFLRAFWLALAFWPALVLADSPTYDEVKKGTDELVAKYGSFSLGGALNQEAQAYLDGIVAKVREPGDPRLTLVYVNHPADFIGISEVVTGPDDKKHRFIVIFKGAVDECPNEDRLYSKIDHEIGHSTAKQTRTAGEVRVQKQREEILVADKEGMRRTAKAGRHPGELRAYFIEIMKKEGPRDRFRFWGTVDRGIYVAKSALADHPPDELRITFCEQWLTENEARYRYPKPTPPPPIMVKIQQSKAYEFPKEAPTPEAPKPKAIDAKNPDITVTLKEVLEKLEKEAVYLKYSVANRLAMLNDVIYREYFFHGLVWRYYGNPELKNAPREYNGSYRQDARKVADDILDPDGYRARAAERPYEPLTHYEDGASEQNNRGKLMPIRLAHNTAEDILHVVATVRGLLKDDKSLAAKTVARALLLQIEAHCKYSGPEAPPELKTLLDELAEDVSPVPDVKTVAELLQIQADRDKAVQHQRSLGTKELSVSPMTPEVLDKAVVAITTRYPTSDNLRAAYAHIFNRNRDDTFGTDSALEELDDPLTALVPKMVEAMVATESSGLFAAPGRGVQRLRSFAALKPLVLALLTAKGKGLSLKAKYALINGWSAGYLIQKKDWFPKVFVTPADFFKLYDELNTAGSAEAKPLLELLTLMNGRWTPAYLRRLTELDGLWLRDTSVRRLAAFGAVASRVDRYGDVKPVVDKLSDEQKERYSAPTYQYQTAHSGTLQDWILARLAESNGIPASAADRHALWVSLAQRGGTLTTDDLCESWYLSPALRMSAAQMEDILQKRLVWDFPSRLKVYERWKKLAGFVPPRGLARAEWIQTELERLNQYFPEPSPARMTAHEQLAQSIQATYAETKLIEGKKYRENENLEGLVLRTFSAAFTFLQVYRPNYERGDPSPDDLKLKILWFLLGKGPAPEVLIRHLGDLSPGRVQKSFAGLTPELRAIVINTLLVKPHGLYSNDRTREELIRYAVEGTGEYRDEAKLILEALLYGLAKTAEFQETLALSFILGQTLDTRGFTDGDRQRILLESLGGTGVVTAQRLYQRRLGPYWESLRSTQDHSRPPNLINVFERIRQVMKIDDPDAVIHIVQLLGAASAKTVSEVRYLDGRAPADQTFALKMLRENLRRSNQLEAEKVGYILEYLIKHGGEKYRPLMSVFRDIKRALDLQADSTTEQRNYQEVAALYESGTVDEHGFLWMVARPHPELGTDQEYSHEEVASGVAVSSLTGDDKRRVFSAIASREDKILMREVTDRPLVFERDRHLGNFKVDLTKAVPVIWVYDYPLLSQIHPAKLKAVFQLGGLLALLGSAELAAQTGIGRDRTALEIVVLLKGELGKPAPDFSSRKFSAAITAALGTTPPADPLTQILGLLATAEQYGMDIDPGVTDYLAALQNWERYPSDAGDATLARDFVRKLHQRSASTTRERFGAIPTGTNLCRELLVRGAEYARRLRGKRPPPGP